MLYKIKNRCKNYYKFKKKKNCLNIYLNNF